MKYINFTLLLSASVPSEKRSEKYSQSYIKIKNAQIQIEEAVIGLSRNVFQYGGRLIFGGHPSISPLVALVATEFKINKDVENIRQKENDEWPITIYQSKAYENVIPKHTMDLFNLGYSKIIWTEAVDGEVYNPKIKNKPQCLKSLKSMRTLMMEGNVDALVCIAGMEGVEREFELFREIHPNKPIFLLESTGGATRILAQEYKSISNVNIIDRIDYPRKTRETKLDEERNVFDLIPYTFITALIVQEILKNKNTDNKSTS